MLYKSPSVSAGVLALLCLGYGLQLHSPLRLNTDSIILISMAESAAAGNGFLDHGEPTVHPPGYPALLALLIRLGGASSFSFILLNTVFLGLALGALYRLSIRAFSLTVVGGLNLCSLFLLSFVLLKYFPVPQSDVVFLGVVFPCLALLNAAYGAADRRRYLAWIVSAWLLLLACILVRRAGVALIPAFAFALAGNTLVRSHWRITKRWPPVAAVAVWALMGAVVMAVVAQTSTLRDFGGAQKLLHPFRLAAEAGRLRLTELGDLAVNFPSYRVPVIGEQLFPLVGCAVLGLAIFGAAQIRKLRPIEIYVMSYTAMLFAWPFYGARFWMPVIPLIGLYCAEPARRAWSHRGTKLFAASYLTVFAVSGLAALSYSTYVSYSGPSFPEVYGGGALRATYCAALETCQGGAAPGPVNEKAFYLIRRYNN